MALDINIRNQLQTFFTKLENPIEIHTYYGSGRSTEELRELLEEIVGLSDKITIKSGTNSSVRIPSFSINRLGEETGVVFSGIPMGHEFTSLVLALLQVSGYPPKIDADKIEKIKNINGTFHFETFVSLSCHNCPDVVQALNILSILNPGITHTMIDGALHQEEVKEKNILSVPMVFLNGEHFGQGRMEIDEIIARIDTDSQKNEAERLSKKEPFDILVIGGGPAGASAAVYAARKGIRTGLVSERFGGQVKDTLSIENFISIKSTEGTKLSIALEEHVKEYGVDIMHIQRAHGLEKAAGLIHVTLENGAQLKSKAVIISTGARWRELGVLGEREFKGKGVAYCAHCDGPLFKGKRVAVVGGGNSGVEAAIDLAGIVEHVTLLEHSAQLKADVVLQERLNQLSNVTVLYNVSTNEITGDNTVNGLVYIDKHSQEKRKIDVEGVFVQIGLVPNTDWLKGTLDLNRFGEIIVDTHGATSLPGVFAAGDCTTVPYKQIIIAMGEGSKAALAAFDYTIRN